MARCGTFYYLRCAESHWIRTAITGKIDDAHRMFGKAFEMDYAVHGKDAIHYSVSSSLKNLGSVLQDQRKLCDAQAMFEKALQMEDAIHGEELCHSGTAGLLINVGAVLGGQGKLGEAETMCRKSLDMLHEIHGQGARHYNILEALHGIGSILEARVASLHSIAWRTTQETVYSR